MALDGVDKIREADVDGTVDYHIAGSPNDQGQTVREDYYTSNQETVESLSQWVNPMGFGGISGGVKASDLKAVLHAVGPATGESVIARRHPKRVAGLEWVYSVPKPISTVWATADVTVASRIEVGVLRCAGESVIDWNQKGCEVRIGSNAQNVSAIPVIAQMVHGASRNRDPQLHVHSISSGFAYAADGRAYAIDTLELTRRQSAEAARFHVAVAAMFINEFGIPIEKDGRNFKIGGEHAPSQALIDYWSSRRRDIEVFLEKARDYLKAKKEGGDVSEIDPQVRQFVDGRKSKSPADYTIENRPLMRAIATFTKEAKDDVTQDQLRAKWRAEALEYGFDVEKVFGLAEPLKPLTDEERQAFIDSTLTAMFEKESAVSVYKVEQIFAEQAVGRMSLKDLDACIAMAKQNRDLIAIESAEGYPIFTTAEKLTHELAIVDVLRAGQVGQENHQLDSIVVDGVICGYETMEEEQAAAVRYVAGARSVFVVEGHAGAGKSFTMSAVRETHERSGYETIGVAQNAKAAKAIEESSGISSMTLHRFLGELRDGKRAIGEKSLVVCDEVGLVGSAQGAELLTKAREAGAKVGLVGDRGQMLSIQAGSLMHLAADESAIAVLASIRRQQLDPSDANPNWRREASMKLAAGDVVGALQDFEDRRLLQFAQDRDEAFGQIAREWRELTRSGKSVAVLAHTNADVARLNRALRAMRRTDGEIVGEDIEIRTGSSKSDRIQVAIGDRLITGKNDYYKGVLNGEIGTVGAVREIPGGRKGNPGHEIDLRMENGELRTVDTLTYVKKDGGAYLGYADAMTTYKAQGLTRDATLLYATENLNQRVAYVACTRAGGNTRIILNADSIEEAYVNDQRNAERGPPALQDLRDYIDQRWSKKPEKALALDHISEAEARKIVSEWRTRLADRQESAAVKMALEIQLPSVEQIEPLLTAAEMEQVVTQRGRIDRQISHGRSDKHVVIAYSQGDAAAARVAYGDHVTLVKARREQGLIGHSQALEAVRKAAVITIVHQPGSTEEERTRIESQARRLAEDGNAGKLENFRPELKAGKSFEQVVIDEQGRRLAMREQGRVRHVRIEQQYAEAEESFPRPRHLDDSRGATPCVPRGDTAHGTVDEDASLDWGGPIL